MRDTNRPGAGALPLRLLLIPVLVTGLMSCAGEVESDSGGSAATLSEDGEIWKNGWLTREFDVPEGTVRLNGILAWSDASVNLNFYVYNPSGKLIDYANGSDRPETVEVEAPTPGRWKYAVRNKNLSKRAAYTVTLDFEMPAPPKPDGDIVEEGRIWKNGWLTETFEVPGGTDKLAGTLAWPDSSVNLNFYVYNPSGKLMDYANGSARPETLEVNDPVPGTWKYAVRNKNKSRGADYTVSISFEAAQEPPPPPPPPAPECGDGECNGDEACGSCAQDCGACPGGPATLSDKLVPSHGALFGISAEYKTPGRYTSFLNREQDLGRNLDIYHDYRGWGDTIPNSTHKSIASRGTLLLINWKAPKSGNGWVKVRNGSEDANIDRVADDIKAFGEPIFLVFHHEPENDPDFGSDADYVAAWRRVVDRFRARGAHNAVWVWNMMGWHTSRYDGLYPGDNYVDWIAYDPYNWYGATCGNPNANWTSFGDTLDRFYEWTERHPDKPLMLAEWGTEEHDNYSPTKADWLRSVPGTLQTSYPRIKAVVYFDIGGHDHCGWNVDSSPDAYDAFADIAHDPYLNPLQR